MRFPIIANFHRDGTRLLPGVDQLPAGWFVISWRLMKNRAQRRRAHGRWHAVIDPATGRKIYRILRFSSNLEGGRDDIDQKIIIDWPGWLALSDYAEAVPESRVLMVRRARWYELLATPWRHPDPGFRLAVMVSLVSLAVGVISLLLGASSLLVAFSR